MTDKGFKLKEGEEPGKLIPMISASKELHHVEDAVGRVAMLVATSIFAGSVAGVF